MKRSILLYMLPLLLAFGCKNTDLALPAPPTSALRPLGDYVNNNYDLSLLAAALKKTGLLDTLNGTGPYTMWAPNNAAFNALGVYSPLKFDSVNVDSLRYALRNMILSGHTYISDLPTQLDNKFQTLNMDNSVAYISVKPVGTNVDAATVTIDGCTVNSAPQRNIALQNGVLHIILNVPKYIRGTAQDFLAADTSLSLFQAFLKKANVWDSLKLDGPYTIYAPVNAAFLKYGLTADSINKLDVSRYDRLVFTAYAMALKPHHVFANDFGFAAYGAAITLGNVYQTSISSYNGVNVSRIDGRQNFNSPRPIPVAGGARGLDYMTDNGVVSYISDIMFYPDSLLIK